jgi:hypothetical protein
MRRITLFIVAVAALGLVTSCRPYVIHANGDDCASNVEVAGSLDVRGAVHSNGDLTIGDQGVLKGAITAVGQAEVDPDVVVDADTPTSGVGTSTFAPVDIADYRPGGEVALLAEAAGAYYDFTGKDINTTTLADAGLDPMPTGVYYTDGDIELGYVEATLVAEGRITLHDNGASWFDDPNQVLALSGYTGGCSDPGISLTNDCLFFSGRVVAPTSGVWMDGNSMIEGDTQIVGDWVHAVGEPLVLGPLPKVGATRQLVVGCPATPPL